MSDEEQTPEVPEESSELDAFDELIKNQPDDDPEIETMWDGIKVLWQAMGNEGVLVKGVLILEYIDTRGKVLKWESSPDLAPWDLMGLFTQALVDIQSDSMAEAIVQSIVHDSEEDDDTEDDQ